MAWIRAHWRDLLERHPDHWIVVEGSDLVSASPDIRAATSVARTRGIAAPFVYFVTADVTDFGV